VPDCLIQPREFYHSNALRPGHDDTGHEVARPRWQRVSWLRCPACANSVTTRKRRIQTWRFIAPRLPSTML